MQKDIASIREEYLLSELDESEVLANPVEQFENWFNQAIQSKIVDVNAMTLCTVDQHNIPNGRNVLLKGIENNEFRFFTNYNSQKGKEILVNPHVTLVFYWKELQRQVRIRGSVQKISEEESIEYFQSRPRESQIGAWVSHQSEILSDRKELENKTKKFELEFKQLEQIPKPDYWGGFAVSPIYIEFWQGRASRLHDRICYSLQNDGTWKKNRLSP
ncbi:MAG: pyridoxamine 5'-phosphate oxidase [Chitinophagaceae bacterium]|nr:MAG: pyridoxamine 5'-phosphate oxidase [Bacteroidetes bacterium OLB11]MCC6447947.1 pyridoxamine 5'-phosphate oxidase [Chitinophagaceae bacterium]HMN33393.1 pyridoxamine 5'-phosphate oxidase [Chitinophagaceae bacterium]